MRMNNKVLGGSLMVLALVASLSSPALAQGEDIDFGDDTSSWANDEECDDPRFTGTGMAQELEDADIGKDATDCRTLFEAGQITLASDDAATVAPAEQGEVVTPEAEATAAIDFGDDTAEWAKDDECDDPRFTGTGMASADSLDESNIGKDATDCQAAFDAGTVTLAEVEPATGDDTVPTSDVLAVLAGRIDFGDDTSDYANDTECDDPDFVGSAMATDLDEINRLRDATDCRAAFIAGTVSLKSASTQPAAFDYGSDYSTYANDGECDDWRFTGSGMAKKLFSEDVMGDATDCRTLEEAGEVSIKPVFQPTYALNAPYDSAAVDFGDNSSSYANDDLCDDPRFEGPGTASALIESDRRADANDCRQAFEAGTITLRDGEA